MRTDQGHIVCDLEAAEYMNDYYANIGAKLAEKAENVTWKAHAEFPKQASEMFRFRIITEKECLTLIKQIDITKSSAITDIKDRQQLVRRYMRHCSFLGTYALYIHILYIN